jgi:acyl dehydratase
MSVSWRPDDQTPHTYARLSGDHNPVHLDPEVAQAAGFRGAIVHGMCVLGAVARAAALEAPGKVLRKLDVRFAGPVYPGQHVVMDATPKELPDGMTRVQMKVSVPDEAPSLMAPAAFVFGAADGSDVPDFPGKLLARVHADPRDDDVVAEEFTFSDQDVADYRALTTASGVGDEAAPPMLMGTLGLTDALWYAFSGEKPEEPGNWVHLRQSGIFVRPIETGVTYRCRVQAGLTTVIRSKQGAMVSIPFVVQESAGPLVQAGTVTLLYVLDG